MSLLFKIPQTGLPLHGWVRHLLRSTQGPPEEDNKGEEGVFRIQLVLSNIIRMVQLKSSLAVGLVMNAKTDLKLMIVLK